MSKHIHKIYLDLQEQYTKKYGNKTIVLMQVGGFHEAYATKTRGQDLFKIGSLLNMVCTKKNKEIAEVSEEYPYMLGFPSIAKQKYVKMLVENSYTVVVVDQTTNPPKPRREVTGVYTLGTYIETNKDTNYIVSFFIEEEVLRGQCMPCIGMTAIDLTTGDVNINESYATENDAMYAFTEATRFLYTYNPKEVILYHKINKNVECHLTENKISEGLIFIFIELLESHSSSKKLINEITEKINDLYKNIYDGQKALNNSNKNNYDDTIVVSDIIIDKKIFGIIE